ncbi:MAG: hypothetical protein F7C35_09070 [Desulfurococcales archaeon]|nr:hypothetical protein [Desulfurococcales archaeon]
MGLDERLEKIERLLEDVLKILKRLEEATLGAGSEARLAVSLAIAFAKPIEEAVAASRRALRALSRLGLEDREDEVTRAIVEALAANGPLSLRGLEREVRKLRGSASRAAIRSRLRMLEEAGVVRVERRGRRMVIYLDVDQEEAFGPH